MSNFWRSLEIPLINCKIHIELNWFENFILSSAGDSAKFEITDAKLQLSNGIKRSVYWNSYQTIPAKVIDKGTNIYELFSVSFQSVRKFFVLAYVIDAYAENNEAGIKNNRKNFLPIGKIKMID